MLHPPGARTMTRPRTFLSALLWAALLLVIGPGTAVGADPGNCLLCHRYRGLSRVDDDGKLRLFYVNEDTYSNSVHARVDCEECHTDVDRIPHDPAQPVDCLSECHLTEPTSERKFSHSSAADALEHSVHSPLDRDGQPKPYPEDYPDCKDCHDNPLYRPMSYFKGARPGISEVSIGRCRVCHESDEFIFQYYNHITTRLHRIRSPKNLGEACSRCHDDELFVKRHKLKAKAVVAYEETLHGKGADMLDETVPDCLDCHVTRGGSVHAMLDSEDSQAPTNIENKASTCAQEVCHPRIAKGAAQYEVHAEFDPSQGLVRFWFTLFFYFLAGGVLLPLLGIILLDLLRRNFPEAVFVVRGGQK